jgi:N-acetylglucosaminyldiphosphoundecaprenol N-acetyl-beta-D-mannosaminyltransferase
MRGNWSLIRANASDLISPEITAIENGIGHCAFPRVEYLGVRFDGLSQEEVINWLRNRDNDSLFAFVVTPNVDHVVRLLNGPGEFRRPYDVADLCLCDSRVLKRLAAFSGLQLTVVPGSDLVAGLFRNVIRPGDRVLLVGGTQEAASKLMAIHPGLDLIHHEPPMGLVANSSARIAAVEAASASHARFILLAVGSPQQELLALEMQESRSVSGTALCIGAGVEFIVGAKTRAPPFIQKAGLEWGWRLLSEPRRLWRRYLVNDVAIFAAAIKWHLAKRR